MLGTSMLDLIFVQSMVPRLRTMLDDLSFSVRYVYCVFLWEFYFPDLHAKLSLYHRICELGPKCLSFSWV